MKSGKQPVPVGDSNEHDLGVHKPKKEATGVKAWASFRTDIGRRFTASPLEYLTPPDGRLVLRTIRSHDRQADRFRPVASPTAKGRAAAYSPEANALVHQDKVARESNAPGFKAIFVRFVPHGGPAAAA